MLSGTLGTSISQVRQSPLCSVVLYTKNTGVAFCWRSAGVLLAFCWRSSFFATFERLPPAREKEKNTAPALMQEQRGRGGGSLGVLGTRHTPLVSEAFLGTCYRLIATRILDCPSTLYTTLLLWMICFAISLSAAEDVVAGTEDLQKWMTSCRLLC